MLPLKLSKMISEEQIRARVKELGEQIKKDFKGPYSRNRLQCGV
jgi:hypoxanthine-guanine phosphoribosyltransferase